MVAKTKRVLDGPLRPNKRVKLEVQQTLYIKNLNDKVNRSMLKHNLFLIFSTYGEILEINMKMKGQAHVVFESRETASLALKALQDTNVFGKHMHIDFARQKSIRIVAAEKAMTEE